MNDMQFEELKRDIDDIKRAVIGDEKFGQDGLVSRVKNLESWRRNLDLRMASISGFFMAVGLFLKWLFFERK